MQQLPDLTRTFGPALQVTPGAEASRRLTMRQDGTVGPEPPQVAAIRGALKAARAAAAPKDKGMPNNSKPAAAAAAAAPMPACCAGAAQRRRYAGSQCPFASLPAGKGAAALNGAEGCVTTEKPA